ncbi:MAG: DUF3822 family protein [Bacteroidales bacterium]|nr:DUF3822 family protein [Bacteroidales bacterium]
MNTYKLESLIKIDDNIITSETNLSICLTASGFYFSLVDNKYRLKCLGEFSVDLNGGITQIMMNVKACFTSIGVHIFNFNNVRIVCPSTRNTWIPYRLYDVSKNKEYLSTTNIIHSSDTIIANTSEKLDAVNIFAYPLHVYSGLKVVMPKAHFVCPSYVMTEYAFDIASLKKDTFIICKREGLCDFVLFKNGQFTLSNTFTYKTPEDLIYFVLYTMQQTGINSGDVCLLLTGEAYTKEEQDILQKFVKEVSYANPTENIVLSEEFSNIDLQKYFMVLA